MSEPTPLPEDETAAAAEAADERVDLDPALVYEAEEAIEADDYARIRAIAEDLHEADLADLIESLTRDDRAAFIESMGARLEPEVLPYITPSVREEVIEQLGPARLARILSDLESDDAVDVFFDLDEAFQHRILAALPKAYRLLLEESLTYPEDSAGRLMQREIVVVPSAWTAGETIDFMRAADELPDDFYDIYVVNPKHQPIGYMPLSRLLRARRPNAVTEVMEQEMRTIPLDMDQEDVAYLFRQYALVSAPVVDAAGRIVGVIMIDDIVEVIDEEAEEDMMMLSGVSEADLYSDTWVTIKARSIWLAVNLLTAIAASLVIGLFSGTIEQLVALAVLMPIVASMGGNAGTQTVTVAVRALAMKDLTETNSWRFVGKELMVGSFNGLLFAVLVGSVTYFWFADAKLGLVIAAAMIVNMIVAGLSGTMIPIGLEKIGVDPAIASSVFLTTVTDVIGFFAFLGLAAIFLL